MNAHLAMEAAVTNALILKGRLSALVMMAIPLTVMENPVKVRKHIEKL